jgi:hypothetical protein
MLQLLFFYAGEMRCGINGWTAYGMWGSREKRNDSMDAIDRHYAQP